MGLTPHPRIRGTSRTPSSSYRPEIDGLRALAVVAVIANHFHAELLPSGYLGVDIFFVISGYVITGSLGRGRAGSLGELLRDFYTRRVKRLVPALLVFVAVTSVLICLFNPNPQDSLETGITALFGFSNVLLFSRATDYFASATELNLFTHTWSLGVEEQFYLLFPVAAWISGFSRRSPRGASHLWFFTLALSLISLGLFVVLYPQNQPAAYFLMPARFWEIGTGCLLFLSSPWIPWLPRLLQRLPSLAIIAALLAALAMPQERAIGATVATVLLTAALIGSLRPGTAGYGLMTLSWMRGVGLISYSLYLWHWGVLAISRWTIGIHPWTAPLQILLMLLLAWLSYRYVETPFREATDPGHPWRPIATGLAGMATASLMLAAMMQPRVHYVLFRGVVDTGKDRAERYLKRPPSAAARAMNRRRQACGERTLSAGLQGLPAERERLIKRGDLCFFHPASTSTMVAFVGDSHANAIVPIADRLALANHPVLFLSKPGCVFPPLGEAGPGCLPLMTSMEEVVIREFRRRGGGILVAESYLQGHFGDEGHLRWQYRDHPSGDHVSVEANFRSYLQSLGALATRLEAVHGALVVIGPKPDHEFYARNDDLAARERCSRQWFAPNSGEPCHGNRYGTSRQHILSEAMPLLRSLQALEQQHRNLFVYQPLDVLCPGKTICSIFKDGRPLYVDPDHLSVDGAMALYPDFHAFLASRLSFT